MTVEHYRTRATAPDMVFEWSNLLGVCPGDVGVKAAERVVSAGEVPEGVDARFHCDTHRGQIRRVEDQELFVDPTRLGDPDATFRYTLAGEILPAKGVEDHRRDEIATTIARLNLNIWRLKRNRATVYQKVRERVRGEFERRSEGEARRRLRQWMESDPAGEYCEVELSYLRGKLRAG